MVEGFFNATATNRAHEDPSDENSELCGGVPDNAMHLIRDAQSFYNLLIISCQLASTVSRSPDAADLPWTGMLLGLGVNSIWYWCSDQVGERHLVFGR